MENIKDFRHPPMDAHGLHLTETNHYRRFIGLALDNADTICMTYHGSFNAFQGSEWGFLSGSVLRHEITDHTPVTKGPTVCLIYLKIDQTTRAWLKGKQHIYDFPSRGAWFDDLCLVKNQEVVFSSCTHEAFCSVSRELSKLFQ